MTVKTFFLNKYNLGEHKLLSKFKIVGYCRYHVALLHKMKNSDFT